MTESEPNNVSPEERLLQVIRGEENNAAPVAASAPPPAPPPVVRPKLKTAVAVPAATPASAKKISAATSEPAVRSAPESVKPVVPAKPTMKSAVKATATSSAKSQTRPRLKAVPPAPARAAAAPSRASATASARPEPAKLIGAAASAAPVPASAPTAPSGKPVARRSGLGVASRLLSLAALVFLLLSAWEIWGAYQADDPRAAVSGREPSHVPEPAFVPDPTPLPDLDSVLALYRQRPLLTQPTSPEPTGPPPTRPGPAPQADWEKYLRDHLRLLGFSRLDGPDGGMEALVSDAKTGRMHYLRIGSPLLAEGKQLTVAAMEKDRIVLTDGDRKIPLR